MNITVVTLFPELFEPFQRLGVVGRAIQQGVITLDFVNPREFARDKHRTVDDRPFGGGPGMLMKVEPLVQALASTKAKLGGARTIYLSPQGRRLDHAMCSKLSLEPSIVLLAGRYEGIDERVIESHVDEEISLGDFVLSGGEVPAMALIESVSRLVPGVLGHSDSAKQDSFADGLLDHPHYTRPDTFEGRDVPEVLKSGNHQAIARWRLKQRLGKTWLERPDLLENLDLTNEQHDLLDEFRRELDK